MRSVASFVVALGATLSFAASVSAAPLPNGMTSLSETYGDWIVACQMQNDALRCQMSQTQTDQKTQQLFLAMEVRRNGDGTMGATLLMPFGLALKSGVSLQVEEARQMVKAEFSTCLPNGCLAPIGIDQPTMQALLAAKTLNISAVAAQDNKPFPAKVSLSGFAAGWARLTELTK